MGTLDIDLIRLGGDADFSLMPGLFPPETRRHVRAFSRFVRLADGVADNAWLTRAEKIARLEVLEAALYGQCEAEWSEEAATLTAALCESLAETGVSPIYAATLVRAFRHDVAGLGHGTWPDLIAYCRVAAAPIGRYMLDLCGEDAAACGEASDALCAALRILKRLRDCRDPTMQVNRLCIPEQFMEDAMITVYHLKAPTARGQTRAVIDRVLDGVDRLLVEAAPLPKRIRNDGLAMHTAIVLCRARKLALRFRDADPMQGRVELSRSERRHCAWSVIFRSLFAHPR